MFADVILPLHLPNILTYGVPYEMQDVLQPGMRVEVSLGRNKQYAGVVKRLHNEKPEAYDVKPVRNIIDEVPVVNEKQLQLWDWVTQYYMAAPGEVMQAALPAHLKLSGETRLQWAPRNEHAQHDWTDEGYLAMEALQLRSELTMSELRAITGARYFAAVLNELIDKQTVIIHDSLEPVYKPKRERIVSLSEKYKDERELSALFDEMKRAPRQVDLLMAYVELSVKNGSVRQQELLDRASASAAQIKSLADKGIFIVTEQEMGRVSFTSDKVAREIIFTPAQQKAYHELEKGLDEKNVTLLQGVTGSGKTLLYIHKIKACLAQGKQAVFLLPEIGLTTQLVSRLYAYFGEELGVYHSRFTNNERVEIWEKVRKGTYKIIVGARSALWLPYDNLGLIIVDEEHDGSYKQKDPAPRFHARDASIYLASLHHAKVILGSATPSIESMYNVQQGKYAFAALKERYMGVQMPAIEIVNARSLETQRQPGLKLLTPEMQQAMVDALSKQKQVILFQNRRGYSPFQVCTVCGWVPHCKNCAVSLTYHKSSDKMHCHYCGLKAAVLHTCPSCGSNRLVSKTFGTEKLEEEVQQIFPKVRVARMDVDSMRGKQSMQDLLDKVEKQKVDVLVGTQMVVKGLDFETIGLVGILSADSLLSYPDFRVNERAFQLMEQVSGRAGRADGAGRVVIQAYNVAHPVLQLVKEHDVNGFYEQEIKYREQFAYPPFSRLIKLIIRHKDEAKAANAALQMAEALRKLDHLLVQGPGPAIISRVRNQYIQEVWLKCPRDSRMLTDIKSFIRKQRDAILEQKGNGAIQILFDVDPVG